MSIEDIDKFVLGEILSKMTGENYRILILSDHKTLTDTRGHAHGYVPYILYDSRVQKGSGRSYTEANGLLGPHVEDGVALMGMLFRE